ncbi:uncharacterized protein LOC135198489 [Macrobrachium nipponense]|uniref:uncharacterized protein LOC135198489 n=1 Tax=Macrobrachium nipponense TaxID=159736 RepID=UPI0030C8A020
MMMIMMKILTHRSDKRPMEWKSDWLCWCQTEQKKAVDEEKDKIKDSENTIQRSIGYTPQGPPSYSYRYEVDVHTWSTRSSFRPVYLPLLTSANGTVLSLFYENF